ncbi:hypothetical protein EZS27_003609 [termite gut metagenome]|uniref:Uncharacterized protein n=1 Tax=termite gut metagenome TaxID=433724 RepID=A0A5J4SS41_9ZZZZ
MKQKWDAYIENLIKFGELIKELAEGLAPSPQTEKIKKQINATWETIRRSANDLTEIISPEHPEQIEMPYQGETFSKYWERYKEYLAEEFHIYLRSRRENELLRTLKKWAGNSEKAEKKAIDIISFHIRSGYKSFFRPTERQLSGEEPTPEEQAITPNKVTKKSQV